MQKNINANILDNINKITKGIQIKSNSSNTSKYKLNNKSINNNINNSPISKIKYNHLYKDDKKKVEIADNNNINNNNSQQNDNKIINNNISREMSAGVIKQKEKINKKGINENKNLQNDTSKKY
jgi:hypothetical protein